MVNGRLIDITAGVSRYGIALLGETAGIAYQYYVTVNLSYTA